MSYPRPSPPPSLIVEPNPPVPNPTPVPKPAPLPSPPPPLLPTLDDCPIDAPIPKAPVSGLKNRNDDFYRAWDRFNRRGAVSNYKSKDFTGKGVVASLDVDVEGNPGHRVESDSDGVIVTCEKAKVSYDSAVGNCKAKIRAIVQECRRLNQKYYDRTFDLPNIDTLVSLGSRTAPASIKGLAGVGSVKRVEDIYDEPEFFEDGVSAQDVRQGRAGDCWFLAALTAMSGAPNLIERICVDRDEQVGVYGFVFFRDGEWVSEVIDDRLCLIHGDDAESAYRTEFLLKVSGEKDLRKTPLAQLQAGRDYGVLMLDREFRESLRKGSNALYFASCRSSNETWLPLLEKAYAKMHGDYQAIEGGFAGEGIEDLTGGVATYIRSEDILDKDRLWQELLQVNEKFLFGCGSMSGGDYDAGDEDGFVRGHAYTVLEAREVEAPIKPEKNRKKWIRPKTSATSDQPRETKKVRLLCLHNPWGKTEWTGAWSDGSQEWTPEIMRELNHSFGDDGIFWLSYADFLKYYPEIDRIRLIDDEWHVAQQWTTVNVPWTTQYLETRFKVSINKAGPVVFVLSQPDLRHHRGLEGRYKFNLHFRLYREGEYTYLLRSMEDSGSGRSCTAELELEPGIYTVMVKITASRDTNKYTTEEMVRTYRDIRKDKLLAVGKSFDLAHSKGQLREVEKANLELKREKRVAREQKEMRNDRNARKQARARGRLRTQRIKDEFDRKREEKKHLKRGKIAAEKNPPGARPHPDQTKDVHHSEHPDTIEIKESSNSEIIGAAAAEAKGDISTEAITQYQPAVETKEEATTMTKESVANEKPLPIHSKAAIVVETSSGSEVEFNLQETVAEVVDLSSDKTEDTTEITVGPRGKENEGIDDNRDDVSGPQDTQVGHDEPRPGTPLVLASDKEGKVNEPRRCQYRSPPRGRYCDSNDEDDENAISPVSSVADEDFDWDPSMDGPLYVYFHSDEDDGDDLPRDKEDQLRIGEDPWNAVCVIGLRVASLNDGEVKIEVVREWEGEICA